jgi:hypothetical protein
MIEFYSFIDNRSHGHDACAADRVDDVVFVAVADGLTSSDYPLEAAQTAIDCALNAFRAEPRQPLNAFVRRLTEGLTIAAANRSRSGSAETTLTTVILHQEDSGTVDAMFTASGDSPIYVAYPGPIMDLYPDTFLTVQVHGKPIQVENAGRVYSFIDCSTGRISGRLATGTFQMIPGELCIVCTDGVPFNEYILRDLRRGGGSHRFFNEILTGNLKGATDELFSRLRSADALSDDATLIALSVQTSGTAALAAGAGEIEASDTANLAQVEVSAVETGDRPQTDVDDAGQIGDCAEARPSVITAAMEQPSAEYHLAQGAEPCNGTHGGVTTTLADEGKSPAPATGNSTELGNESQQ